MNKPADRFDEREWNLQERALREERLHAAAGDPDVAAYRRIVRTLREPLPDALPTNFAASVAAQAFASSARASSRWRGGKASTSGNACSGRESSSSSSTPMRWSLSDSGLNGCVAAIPRAFAACKAAPSLARRNNARSGRRSAPSANGCSKASSAGSRVAGMRAV
jgi:hypothetical protein